MQLQEKEVVEIDYLSDWPAHYYEIETPKQREAYLLTAMEQKLDPAHDACRLALLKKRFGTEKNGKYADNFLHAWMMIQAASASGVSFFGKKQKEKELRRLLSDLCIIDYPLETNEKAEVLTAEWQNFALVFLAVCAGSKSYCSTLFGIVPVKDETVAKKIAAEIDLITRKYPALFGLEDVMLPFRQIMADTFCKKIEHGSAYWNEVISR